MSKTVVITGVFYSPIPEKEQGCISARNAFWKESAHRQGINLEVWATCNRFSNEAVSNCLVKEFLGLPQDTLLDYTVPPKVKSEDIRYKGGKRKPSKISWQRLIRSRLEAVCGREGNGTHYICNYECAILVSINVNRLF